MFAAHVFKRKKCNYGTIFFENIVNELKDERTHFTSPHNDDELSAGAALFVSDQLMKTKKGEIITNTKNKIQSKEI